MRIFEALRRRRELHSQNLTTLQLARRIKDELGGLVVEGQGIVNDVALVRRHIVVTIKVDTGDYERKNDEVMPLRRKFVGKLRLKFPANSDSTAALSEISREQWISFKARISDDGRGFDDDLKTELCDPEIMPLSKHPPLACFPRLMH